MQSDKAPQVIISMLDQALIARSSASYVLRDSWFRHTPRRLSL
ncbi:hypothetical protein WMW72_13060 [Paenibacillus filicis]|uniref:Uncharacterized protein n=1 Tax=Paenibacillus filicis TaxID=669464 RepID=A0ABU9DJ11_9BACL